MTPLEFFIAVKNSEAMNGLQEVQQKVEGFKEETNALYEGPAREMKIRTEIRGMIKDVSLGKDPIFSLISAFERLSEVAKFAGPVAAALAVGFGLNRAMVDAATSAQSFFDLFQKGMAVSVKDSSQEALRDLVKTLDEAEEKYKARGFMERVFFGKTQESLLQGVRDQREAALHQIDEVEAATIAAKTAALRSMTDEQIAMEGQIAATRLDYEEKIRQARLEGNMNAAQEWEIQMSAAIDRIQEKQAKAHTDLFAQQRQQVRELEMAESFGPSRISGLQKQKADLEAKLNLNAQASELQAARVQFEDRITQARVAGDLAAVKSYQEAMGKALIEIQSKYDQPGIVDPTGQRVKDEIAVAHLQKQINEEQASLDEKKAALDKQKAEDAKRAAAAELEAAKRTDELRKGVVKAQFDALNKEDQIIVMRAAASRLESELSRVGVYSSDARLELQKELAGLQKRLADAEKTASPWKGVDADTALRGSLSSGTFGRVTNDAANRAEKQRDDMVGYLKTIASRGAINDVGAF